MNNGLRLAFIIVCCLWANITFAACNQVDVVQQNQCQFWQALDADNTKLMQKFYDTGFIDVNENLSHVPGIPSGAPGPSYIQRSLINANHQEAFWFLIEHGADLTPDPYRLWDSIISNMIEAGYRGSGTLVPSIANVAKWVDELKKSNVSQFDFSYWHSPLSEGPVPNYQGNILSDFMSECYFDKTKMFVGSEVMLIAKELNISLNLKDSRGYTALDYLKYCPGYPPT